MDWLKHLFAEDVWTLIWVIALLALVLLIAMVATRRSRLLIGIVSLAALAVVLLVIERLWVTDRERVDAIIDDIAQSVRQGDTEGIVRHLAPQCHYGSLDREGIRRMVDSVFHTFELEKLTISSRKTELFSRRKEATAEFLAVVRAKQANLESGPYPTRWTLTFTQTSTGEWQVLEIQQIPAFGENHQPVAPINPAGIPRP